MGRSQSKKCGVVRVAAADAVQKGIESFERTTDANVQPADDAGKTLFHVVPCLTRRVRLTMDDMRTAARRRGRDLAFPAHTSPHSRSRRVVPTRRATMAASDAEDADDNAVVLLDDSSDGGADAAGGTDDEAPGPAATDDDPARSGEASPRREGGRGARGREPVRGRAPPPLSDDWMAEIEAREARSAQRVARERERRSSSEKRARSVRGARREKVRGPPKSRRGTRSRRGSVRERLRRRARRESGRAEPSRPSARERPRRRASGTAPDRTRRGIAASPLRGIVPPRASRRREATARRTAQTHPGALRVPASERTGARAGAVRPLERPRREAVRAESSQRRAAPFVAPTEDDDGAGDARPRRRRRRRRRAAPKHRAPPRFRSRRALRAVGSGSPRAVGRGRPKRVSPPKSTGLFAPAIGETNGNGAPARRGGGREDRARDRA